MAVFETEALILRSYNLAEADKIISTDAGAKVKVLNEAYNEREVRILEGSAEGKTGWVPFEWLKPLQPGDH